MRSLILLLAFLISFQPLGWCGASRDFAGSTTNRMDVGTRNVRMEVGQNQSVCAWIKPASLGGLNLGRVAHRGFSNTRGVYFGLSFTSTIRLLAQGSTGLVRLASNNSISLNAWNFVCYTWDGSTTASNVKLYVGGVETSYQTTTNGSSTTSNSSDNTRVGNDNNNNSRFDGLISQLQMFNRILTVDEINQLMHNPGSISDGLTGYWPLFGSDSPELELSGYNDTGTLTGTSESTDGPPIFISGGYSA